MPRMPTVCSSRRGKGVHEHNTRLQGDENNGLYQGSRWQYRWAAPQYVDRMIEWVGRDSLCAQLSYFFDNNLYNQGNEPDIHVPFLFNRFGAPERRRT